jgi:hypothetical protein
VTVLRGMPVRPPPRSTQTVDGLATGHVAVRDGVLPTALPPAMDDKATS